MTFFNDIEEGHLFVTSLPVQSVPITNKVVSANPV